MLVETDSGVIQGTSEFVMRQCEILRASKNQTMTHTEFNDIRAQIRNLLTPMLTLSMMVKEDAESEYTKPTAKRVEINVNKILALLEDKT